MMRYTLAALSAAALIGGAFQAQACNPMLGKNFGKHVAPTAVPAAMLARNNPGRPTRPGLVGLWNDVRTASDGSLFMEGFDTWAENGTEYELANLPPATGSLCVGTYTKHGKNFDLLAHVTYLYDQNQNNIGTLDITQTARLSADGNSYTGPFDAKFYDLNGNVFMEVTGTANGTRLVQ